MPPRSSALVVGLCLCACALPALAAEERAPPVPAISLRDAIARALRWHPRDREAVANVERAIARFRSVRAEALPRFMFRYEHIWEDSKILSPKGVHDPLDLNLVAIFSEVPIIRPLAWSETAETRERIEVSEAEAAATRRSLGLAAARAWIGTATAAHALDVELEGLRTAREHAAFVRSRLDSGAASVLDSVRADKEIAVAAALVDRARAAQLRAQQLLGLVTGAAEPLDANREDDHPLSDPPRDEDHPVADVVAAERALHAARTELHNVYTRYLPSLGAEVIGFYQDHPQPVLPVTGVGYAVFLRLTYNIFDGGAREAEWHARRAEAQRSQARLDDIARAITVEKRDGESDVVRLRAALDETTAAAKLARSALALTERRYAEGKGSQLDVIYALRESRDADIAVAAAEEDWRRASLDLLAARGLIPAPDELHDIRSRRQP